MELSQHFTLDELTASESAARLGIHNEPDALALDHLRVTAVRMEQVRDLLDLPIHVNSGYRSPALNMSVGGVTSSAHCMGWAVDFICPRYGTPYDVATAIYKSAIKYDQLILEYGWVHISFDPRMRGEVLTKKSASSPYEHGLHQ